jgi:hypothetical protein
MWQRKAIIGFLLSFLALTATVTAQTAVRWKVVSAVPLTLQSGVGLRTFPAPDGQQIAYERKVRLNSHQDLFMCAANVVSGEEPVCLKPLQDMPRGFDADAGSYFYPLGWSPDATQIAVVGQPLVTSLDTDLWIMDASTWTNLTDDGYEGPLTQTTDSSGPPAGVSIEVQPTWSPDGTQIAVERTVIDETGHFAPSTLSLIDAASGEITNLTPLPGHDEQAWDAGATTSVAWSPDGSTLALSVRHREPNPDNDGIWLIDTESGTSRQLVSATTAAALFAEIFTDVPADMIGPISWSPSGTALLFWVSNPSTRPVALWAFWVDVASGQTTALYLPPHPKDTGTRRGVWPFQATWSPDGSSILVAANGLHPDDEKIPLDPNNSRVRISVYLVTVDTADSTLLGHLPTAEAAPFYFASWSGTGDVILDGYRLVMEQE